MKNYFPQWASVSVSRAKAIFPRSHLGSIILSPISSPRHKNGPTKRNQPSPVLPSHKSQVNCPPSITGQTEWHILARRERREGGEARHAALPMCHLAGPIFLQGSQPFSLRHTHFFSPPFLKVPLVDKFLTCNNARALSFQRVGLD